MAPWGEPQAALLGRPASPTLGPTLHPSWTWQNSFSYSSTCSGPKSQVTPQQCPAQGAGRVTGDWSPLEPGPCWASKSRIVCRGRVVTPLIFRGGDGDVCTCRSCRATAWLGLEQGDGGQLGSSPLGTAWLRRLPPACQVDGIPAGELPGEQWGSRGGAGWPSGLLGPDAARLVLG